MTNVLFMDFNSSKEAVKGRPKFSSGLDDQFYSIEHDENLSFDDFVRLNFAKDGVNAYVSYPNFIRKTVVTEHGDRYYNNIAIRFPKSAGKNDLVLMGDIFERRTDRFRKFIVKAILSVDGSAAHYGEKKQKCDLMIQLSKYQWETSGDTYERPTPEQISNNLFSENFMLDLNSSYVVKEPGKVREELDTWSKYLESREKILELDSKEGYRLNGKPEILQAYVTDGIREGVQPVPFLESNGGHTWSINKLNSNSVEVSLLHVYVDYFESEYRESQNDHKVKKKKDLKKKFDAFTRAPNILVDPNARKEKGRDDFEAGVILSLRDCRISPSNIETIEPADEIVRIQAKTATNIRKAEDDVQTLFKNDVSAQVKEFESKKLPQLVAAFSADQEPAVRARIISEMNAAKEKEKSRLEKEIADLQRRIESKEAPDSKGKKKGPKDEDLDKSRRKLQQDLDTIDSRYDIAGAVTKEVGIICDDFKETKISDRRAELSESLKAKYDQITKERKQAILKQSEEDIKKAKDEGTIVRFHIYYDLREALDGQKKPEKIQERMTEGLEIRKDFIGDWVIIRRQKEALSSFREGYVMNPFLATALFSPDTSGSTHMSIDDIKFYQKQLNEKQKEAVARALGSNGMFLIQGPPGTGKTQVIAEIATQFALRGRKVLISSENNKAVDNAFGRIPKLPTLRLVRVLHEDRAEDNQFSANKLLGNLYRNMSSSLREYVSEYDNLEGMIEDLNDEISKLKALNKSIDKAEKSDSGVLKHIEELESEIEGVYAERESVTKDNNVIAENVSDLEDELQSIKDFSDEEFFARTKSLLEGKGLSPSSYGDSPEFLKSLASYESSAIHDQYDMYEEHRTSSR